jgi:hypothetical protein
MGVAINQSRQHRHVGKVDYHGSRRKGRVRPSYGRNFFVTDDDQLVRENVAGLDIDEFSGANHRDCRGALRRSSFGGNLRRGVSSEAEQQG